MHATFQRLLDGLASVLADPLPYLAAVALGGLIWKCLEILPGLLRILYRLASSPSEKQPTPYALVSRTLREATPGVVSVEPTKWYEMKAGVPAIGDTSEPVDARVVRVEGIEAILTHEKYPILLDLRFDVGSRFVGDLAVESHRREEPSFVPRFGHDRPKTTLVSSIDLLKHLSEDETGAIRRELERIVREHDERVRTAHDAEIARLFLLRKDAPSRKDPVS